MINKRFLNFKTYAEFDRLKEAGEIRPESIVWIADTNQMWTHDTLYNSITEEQARKLAGISTDGAGLKYLTDKLTYEELPDQATVIDIDGKIMDLTTESSNEDILAVFGTLPDFTSLIETVRNSETILNSILVDDSKRVGKVNATILANKDANVLHVVYFDHVKKTFVRLSITETDSVLSCIREEFGSAGSGDKTPEVAIIEAEPVPGSQEKAYYQVVEDSADLGVDTDAPADGNMYGRKDNAWQKIEAAAELDNVYVFDYKNITVESTAELKNAINTGKTIVINNNPNYYYATRATAQIGNVYLSWQSIAEENVTIFNNSSPATVKQSSVTSYFLTIKESDGTSVLTSNKTGISSGGASLSDALSNGYTVASSGYASKKYSKFMFFANADLGESTPVIFDNVNIFRTNGDTVYKRVMPDKNGKLYEFSFIITNGESAKITAKEIPSGSVDLSNYLAKDNTTEFTPSADYDPATKKYVDDSTVYKYEYKQFSYQYEMGNNSINNSFQYEASVNISKKSYIAGVNFKSSNGFIYSLVLPGNIIEYQAESNITCNADFRFNEINSLGYKVSLHIIVKGNLKINFNDKAINYNITNVNAICEQCILTESEYAALGDTPNTDNILYFVTPDA